MIPKKADLIEEGDLQALVDGAVAERRDLEFKADIHRAGDDDGNAEFVRDVTALANTAGGDIVYGLSEAEGVATSVTGIVEPDMDGLKLRLQNLIRSRTDPRLSTYEIQPVRLANGRSAVVVRVKASFAAPHCAVSRGRRQYFTRHGSEKHEMDAHELRVAFNASEEYPARLRQLHVAAIRSAEGHEMPVSLESRPRAIVSLVPLSLLRERLDLRLTPEDSIAPYFIPSVPGFDALEMLEGVLLHTPLGRGRSGEKIDEGAVASYVLTHRRGWCDAAWTVGSKVVEGAVARRLVSPESFERGLVSAVSSCQSKLGALGVDGPWGIFVTVQGIKGYSLMMDANFASKPAWREGGSIGDLMVDRLSQEALEPILRAFWLLFGEHRPEKVVAAP